MHVCTEGRLTQDASESSIIWSTIKLFSTLECNILKVTETISKVIREGAVQERKEVAFVQVRMLMQKRINALMKRSGLSKLWLSTRQL